MATFKCIEFPGVEFPTQKEMFAELKRHENDIITLKKKQSYEGRMKHSLSCLNVDVTKAFSGAKSLPFEVKSDYIYPVISTTKYMDSHNDVHFDTCFNRTYKNQAGHVAYALDHELKYNSIIAWPKNVEMIVSNLPWGAIGKDYTGETEGLIFAINKADIRIKSVLDDIESKAHDFENSIRMIYKQIFLAIDSTDKELQTNKQNFDLHLNMIANKEKAQELGYYWGVKELAIDREGSLVVAGGSNDATGIITVDLVKSTSVNHKTKTILDSLAIGTPQSKTILDYLN